MTRTPRPTSTRATLLLAPLLLASCTGGEGETALTDGRIAPSPSTSATCTLIARETLPAEVRETSGLALGAREPLVLWTHNDAGNEPVLFAIDPTGRVVDRVRVNGAELTDWEDIEAAPCGDGTCLFIGDIGDNDSEREHITVYRIPEPAAGADETAPAVALHARFPDGPRDAEALFIGPDGALYIVTKGRSEPVALYRWPTSQPGGGTGLLEQVRVLFPEPAADDDRVTAATTSPDGALVGVRTYRSLYVYPLTELLSGDAADATSLDLSVARQTKGESLAISPEGDLWLTSEAEESGSPTLARLRCELPRR